MSDPERLARRVVEVLEDPSLPLREAVARALVALTARSVVVAAPAAPAALARAWRAELGIATGP